MQHDNFPCVYTGTHTLCNEYVTLINMDITTRVEEIEEHRNLSDLCKVIVWAAMGVRKQCSGRYY